MEETASQRIAREIEERKTARKFRMIDIVRAHSRTLRLRRNQLTKKIDAYGDADESEWINEKYYFFEKYILPELTKIGPLKAEYVEEEYQYFLSRLEQITIEGDREGTDAIDAQPNEYTKTEKTNSQNTPYTYQVPSLQPETTPNSNASIWKTLFGLTVLICVGYYFFNANSGFQDAHIIEIKNSIRTEFEKTSGISVLDVSLFKESSHKLNGLVKIRMKGLNQEISKSCSATMATDNKNYMWECR